MDHQVIKVTQEILVTLEILVLQGHPVYTVNFRDPQDLQEPQGRQEFQVCMEHFFLCEMSYRWLLLEINILMKIFLELISEFIFVCIAVTKSVGYRFAVCYYIV